jgi:hypothetical protein
MSALNSGNSGFLGSSPMIDSERFKLLYGPYKMPICKLGEKLLCEYRDKELSVKGITDGLIQWPSAFRGKVLSPIVCGDLVRAIRTESEMAVAHHWGVCKETVRQWRRALNVPRMTNGSLRLVMDYASEKIFTPEAITRAKETLHSAEVRARLSAARKGRIQHPNTIAACRELGRRPKSEEWKRGLSERSKKMWENPEAHGLPSRRKWKEEELALIGTDSDKAVANALGLPVSVVKQKRDSLGISLLARRWNEEQIALLGTAADRQLARTLRKSPSAIQRQREKLGIPAFDPKPWTQAEIALIGTASDPEVGRKLGRAAACVQAKRMLLEIPAFILRWTEAELALLGTDTDENIARLLNRTEVAVKVRRNKSRIPAYR